MFLDDLIARVLGEVPAIVPLRASRFEPAGNTFEEDAEPFAPAAPRIAQESVLQPATLTRVVANAPPVHSEHQVTADPAPAEAPREAAVARTSQRDAPPTRAEPSRVRRRAEPAAERERVPHPPPVAPRTDPLPEVVVELPAPAIVRAGIERRVETRIVERRLQSLVREHTVERIEDRSPVIAPPARPALTPAASAPGVPPPERRAIVVPELKSAPIAPPAFEPHAPSAPPAVHVTIGRVEVRAGTQRAPQSTASRERKPDLESYLRRRERA